MVPTYPVDPECYYPDQQDPTLYYQSPMTWIDPFGNVDSMRSPAAPLTDVQSSATDYHGRSWMFPQIDVNTNNTCAPPSQTSLTAQGYFVDQCVPHENYTVPHPRPLNTAPHIGAFPTSSFITHGLPDILQHTYRRIVPCIEPSTLDASLEPCVMHSMKAYRCLWAGCSKGPFQKRSHARAHVHSHLAPGKLFECITCLEQFSSESTARRHLQMQNELFSCEFCHKAFRRKDYRNQHQKNICGSRSPGL